MGKAAKKMHLIGGRIVPTRKWLWSCPHHHRNFQSEVDL